MTLRIRPNFIQYNSDLPPTFPLQGFIALYRGANRVIDIEVTYLRNGGRPSYNAVFVSPNGHGTPFLRCPSWRRAALLCRDLIAARDDWDAVDYDIFAAWFRSAVPAIKAARVTHGFNPRKLRKRYRPRKPRYHDDGSPKSRAWKTAKTRRRLKQL